MPSQSAVKMLKTLGAAHELSLCTSGVSQLGLFADLRGKFVVVLELVPELLFEHAVEVAVVAAEGQELHRKLLGVVVRLLLVEDDVEPAHLFFLKKNINPKRCRRRCGTRLYVLSRIVK